MVVSQQEIVNVLKRHASLGQHAPIARVSHGYPWA
jgi:hypothetical protein